MRWVTLILVVLILLLQYPLWLGKGGWLKVWDISQKVKAQQQANLIAKEHNAVLEAEVRDLKHGTAAIEERARTDLGMVKQNEIFFQVIDGASAASTATAPQPTGKAQTPSSSTSNTSVASGGITPPAPRRP